MNLFSKLYKKLYKKNLYKKIKEYDKFYKVEFERISHTTNRKSMNMISQLSEFLVGKLPNYISHMSFVQSQKIYSYSYSITFMYRSSPTSFSQKTYDIFIIDNKYFLTQSNDRAYMAENIEGVNSILIHISQNLSEYGKYKSLLEKISDF